MHASTPSPTPSPSQSPSPSPSSALEQGRSAYHRREWGEAFERLERADAGTDGGLGPEDLQRLAISAYLLGREEAFVDALERQHRLHLESGESAAAARSAFWLGFHLAERGDVARASGWFGRASRILEEEDGDRVEAGYLLIPAGYQRFQAGDYEAARRLAGEAAAVAGRFDDRDLLALAVHVEGRALLGLGRVEEGLALLDEAMVAVATDELSPQVTGLIYCSVIGACRSIYALDRAREWTAALSAWCERQPDMVAYRGECRVYRAELMGIEGEWRAAIAEAERAGAAATAGTSPPPTGSARAALGLASYQQGEAHRLLGEWEAAEEAYRAASRAGRPPQPGFALLRLAQGDEEAAASAIDRALTETAEPLRRARLLPAHIEIMLAVDRLEDARRGCVELEELAAAFGRGVLGTMAARARGAVALAAGDANSALPDLRRAWREWSALGAPHDAARARLLLGAACRELGDEDGALLELGAAREAFDRLGAVPDVERADAMIRGPAARGRAHGLTPRELEVLALVATGMTNRAVATELFISEKTVARHLSNIFTKLDLSSRAAATAYAYEHDLLD